MWCYNSKRECNQDFGGIDLNYERSTRLFFIIAAAAFIAIIGLYVLQIKGNVPQQGMYDSNRRLADESDSYTFRECITQNPDHKSLDLDFKGFTGSYTVWLVQASQPGQIRLKYDANVASGRFKIIMLSPEREVVTIVESPRQGSRPLQLQQGEYRIKIVGDQAEGSIKASLVLGQGITAELDEHDF